MNRSNKMNDDELKAFIKNNQPEAPQAEAGELNSIMRRLKLETKQPESNSVWLWLATGVAASLFMFQFLTKAPVVNSAPQVTTAATSAMSNDDDDEEYTELDVPTLDVGEEYLTLAGY